MLAKDESDKDYFASTLTGLGLTKQQAKVYHALIQSKKATANDISEVSEVARPDVYRVLDELEKVGFVTRIIAKPVEFQAIPIDKCLNLLMKLRIDKTSDLSDRIRYLIENFSPTNSVNVESEVKNQFILLPKKTPVYIKTETMLRNAKGCVCFLGLTRSMISWLSSYSSLFEKMLERQVECRIIMPKFEPTQEPFSSLKKYSNFDLRVIAETPITCFSVWDRKELMLTTSTADSATPAPTLWSSNEGLVNLALGYFDSLWVKAYEKLNLPGPVLR
jgi:sugar-specific transcriptional regulator TrmB